MNLKRYFLTENDCYKAGAKHTVKGIMVHSTGANNPNLKRYVQPDDGLLGKNTYNNAWNQATPGGRQVCVHGFIGKLADGTIATYQTLPWDMVGWHSGSGSKGNANRMGYIGFEICEDGLTDATYFSKVYTEAVELCAYLCKEYSLDPITSIICHAEGHAQGIASNHGDVLHWFPKFGKTMDMFRADVAAMLKTAPVAATPLTYTAGSSNEGTVFNFLREAMKLNVAAACGVLANINAESGFRPTVFGDSGTSYGICQWHNTRFTNLKNWCSKNGKDYTTLDGQLWYLKYELEKSYKSVLTALQAVANTAEGAYEAGYVWCKKFEIPADTENASIRRGNLAKTTYWSKYGAAPVTVPVVTPQKPSTLAIGDVVTFMGHLHYSSANSTKGVSCRPGKAKITAMYAKGTHPYHLIREAGGTSNVYGWVDASDIYESAVETPTVDEPTEPKEVETMSRITDFVAFLEGRVGHSIYVWGAQGEKNITEAWIARREDDDQTDINRVLALWSKLKAKGITDIQAFDCSGLVMFWLQNTKGYLKGDMSAAGLCSTCKAITKTELKAGDLVFHHNGTKVAHVGVYVGDGNVIHCRGRDYGVIKEALSKYSWNRFGRLAVLQEGDVTPSQPIIPATVRDLKLTSPMMEGEDVKALQAKLIALGYDLGTMGADGEYGAKTDAAVRLFQTRAKSMTLGICNASMRTTLNL